MKTGSLRVGWRRAARGWASRSAPFSWVLVAMVLIACGADGWSGSGAGGGGVSAPTAAPSAEYTFVRAASGGVRTTNVAQQLDVQIAGGALTLAATEGASWRASLRWTGLGRGATVGRASAVAQEATATDARASYAHADGSQEWYVTGPSGVEQGFVLPAAPAGQGTDGLALELLVGGDLSPALDGPGTGVDLRDATGATVAHYTDLSAVDADGAPLRSWLEVAGKVVRLRVDDANARYPVTIDPIVWTLQQEFAAPTLGAGDWFGYSVSVSGAIAVIGAPNHNAGAGTAYVFLRTGGIWALQQQINAADGAAGDAFGTSVSVSGAIAVIGAPNHAAGAGAAYVFVQSGVTWTQVLPDLTASDGAAGDAFGTSVSVSGTIAVIGAPNHKAGAGAAYVFAQNGAAWPQQTELTATGGAAGDAFGTSVSVSVSSVGTNALVGAPYHTVGTADEAGAAYAFAQSGGTWSQQTLTEGASAAAFDGFGTSVSVDGANAMVGAPYRTGGMGGMHSEAGAVFPFTLGGGSWAAQAALTASDGLLGDLFGFSVSVSGPSAAIGAYQKDVGGTVSAGAMYLFFQTCPSWTQTTEETASDKAPSDFFGYSVAVNGLVAIAGAYQHDQLGAVSAGAVYVYSGAGSALACCIGGTSFAAGTVNPADSCEVCTPASSTSSWSDAANGTACNDGNACTQTDTCQAGVCTGSNLVTCTPEDQCHVAGTCSPNTGVCSNPPATNGTACNDGNACTQTDTCQAGVCTGSNLVTCTPEDQCHVAGTCSPSTGVCSNPPATNGTACSDGNACTRTDTCQAGICVGSNPVVCTASDQCHQAGACDPTSGTCTNPADPDGTACNDGNPCTSSDVCVGGACGGKAYACTPTSCQSSSTCDGLGGCTVVDDPVNASCPDDGNPCTSDVCNGLGTCTHPSRPDGTSCGSGEVCKGGSCGAECFINGVIVASGLLNPLNPCQQCRPSTSTTTWTDVPANTPCPDDGNACTSDLCDGSGTCAHAKLPDGTSCGSGEVCQSGSCGAGCFINGVAVGSGSINPANACQACVPSSSTTTWTNQADGTVCNDGDLCTQTDACMAGTCVGSNPVTCSASDPCHTAGTCDPTSGKCSNPSSPDGTTCSDGDACTLTDTCQLGVCTGSNPVVCVAMDACHLVGVCGVGTGTCTNPIAPDGTVCPGGLCAAGACVSSSSSSSSSSSGTTTSSSSSGAGGSAASSTSSSGSGAGGSTASSTGTGGSSSSGASTSGASTASSSSGAGGAGGAGATSSAATTSSGGAGGGGSANGVVASGGCGCQVPGDEAPRLGWLLGLAPLAFLGRRRSRRPARCL